jgi:hypothetical protein
MSGSKRKRMSQDAENKTSTLSQLDVCIKFPNGAKCANVTLTVEPPHKMRSQVEITDELLEEATKKKLMMFSNYVLDIDLMVDFLMQLESAARNIPVAYWQESPMQRETNPKQLLREHVRMFPSVEFNETLLVKRCKTAFLSATFPNTTLLEWQPLEAPSFKSVLQWFNTKVTRFPSSSKPKEPLLSL